MTGLPQEKEPTTPGEITNADVDDLFDRLFQALQPSMFLRLTADISNEPPLLSWLSQQEKAGTLNSGGR